MATTYTVTNTLAVDTTAIASEVNQNFTDVLTALNAFDAANLSSGTVPLARISGLTTTQFAATTFYDEDDMASDSATAMASQQSIKAHVTASSTDGYTPTSYAAEESTTYPNGEIFKRGYIVDGGTTTTVTFGTAFATAVVTCSITVKASAAQGTEAVVSTFNTTTLTITDQETVTGYYWQAWGY